MITQTNDIERFFERLGAPIRIIGPERAGPVARHQVMLKAGGRVKDDESLAMLLTYYFKACTRKGRSDIFKVRLANFNEAGHGITGICKRCGCTDGNACYDCETGSCWWVMEDVCSACATKEEKNIAFEQMRELGGRKKGTDSPASAIKGTVFYGLMSLISVGVVWAALTLYSSPIDALLIVAKGVGYLVGVAIAALIVYIFYCGHQVTKEG